MSGVLGSDSCGDNPAIPIISAANSTASLLAAGATFTGAWEDVTLYSTVASAVLGSLATDGILYFDLSTDGGTTFTSVPNTIADATFALPRILTIVETHVRIRYVNGTTAQTGTFSLQTKYSTTQPLGLLSSVDGFVDGETPVNVGKVVIVGKSELDDTYINGAMNSAGAQIVADFGTEVARGIYPNYSIDTKFGRNSDIDTASTPEDIWEGTGIYTGQPVSYTPELVTAESGSGNDTSAGTGARTIRITGLKTSTSTDYETEDITMNGTTKVDSVSSWWRVNRCEVLTAGSTGNNVGAIVIAAKVTTANVFLSVDAEYNQSTLCAYTVPFGKQMLIKRIRTSMTRANGSAGSCTVRLMARPTGGVYNSKRVFEIQNGSGTNFDSVGGLVLAAGTDIKGNVPSVSDNNTIVEMAFEFYLIVV